MSVKWLNNARQLRESTASFDPQGVIKLTESLRKVAKTPLQSGPGLFAYAECLQFMYVYAPNVVVLKLVLKEMTRVAAFLKKNNSKGDEINSGLPFRPISTRFSLDFLNWLLDRRDMTVQLNAVNESTVTLNEVLRLTLPSAEREVTSAGYGYDDLLPALGVNEKECLSFLLEQFDHLAARRDIVDFLFDGLDVVVDVCPKSKEISKLFNRLSFEPLYYHNDILRKFDHKELLDRPLPEPLPLNEARKLETIRVIRDAMLLNARETDPATYLEPESLRVYSLERGISVALFDMNGFRQLPYESYIGYTLFKNGYPLAYGGGWVFAKRSLFGINIFDAYRGGESGYIMCQLLRTYRQAFGVDYFEVEPYQYGADNPDGIKSGAFWFYYRYGFRPVDKPIYELANREAQKIAEKKGYRSPEKTLLKFTECNIGLQLASPQKLTVGELTEKITSMISRSYSGNRQLAVEHAETEFATRIGGMIFTNEHERKVFQELALFVAAFEIRDEHKLNLLAAMVQFKPTDPYTYQRLWHEFFA
jgi:hypothetical protein